MAATRPMFTSTRRSACPRRSRHMTNSGTGTIVDAAPEVAGARVQGCAHRGTRGAASRAARHRSKMGANRCASLRLRGFRRSATGQHGTDLQGVVQPCREERRAARRVHGRTPVPSLFSPSRPSLRARRLRHRFSRPDHRQDHGADQSAGEQFQRGQRGRREDRVHERGVDEQRLQPSTAAMPTKTMRLLNTPILEIEPCSERQLSR